MLKKARIFPAPRMEGIVFTERGTWLVKTDSDDAARLTATNRFLETANAIFSKYYTPNDLKTTYYIDQTGYRADVWRFDSTDGVLSGALEAKSLAFLSADCYNEPGDALHASLGDPAKFSKTFDYWSTLDPTSAAARIAGILGGSVHDVKDNGGSGRNNATAGWMIQAELQFQLGDGRYCAARMYADEALIILGLARRGIDPDEPEEGETVLYGDRQ